MTRDYIWALITLVIAVILAILLLMLTRDGEGGAQPKIAIECIDLELQHEIRKLALQGFDLAFVDRVQLLYDTWTRDAAHLHPERGQVGMRNAINAYVYARDLANKWSAKPCATKPAGAP